MILSAQTIRRELYSRITPFHERTVHNGMTFGLTAAGYDIRVRVQNRPDVYLGKDMFILLHSVERVEIPTDMLAIVHDKSTWARQGLALQNTVLEPGWCGYITLELSMHGVGPIVIRDCDPIAQIVFHRLDEPTDRPYTGKYQNQPNRPVAAILEPRDAS